MWLQQETISKENKCQIDMYCSFLFIAQVPIPFDLSLYTYIRFLKKVYNIFLIQNIIEIKRRVPNLEKIYIYHIFKKCKVFFLNIPKIKNRVTKLKIYLYEIFKKAYKLFLVKNITEIKRGFVNKKKKHIRFFF